GSQTNLAAAVNDGLPLAGYLPTATPGGPRPLKKTIGAHMAKPAAARTESQPTALTGNNVLAAQAAPPEGMQRTVITYDYDPLYRLTEAVYTDDIAATHSYVYDAVGNMTAYTDTVGTETTSVSRTFNAANQLLASYHDTLPYDEKSYIYDGNGNLTLEDTVNFYGGEIRYTYNQRNLLTNFSIGAPIGIPPSTTYVYDGDGNRLREERHDDGIIYLTVITYTNDIVGLSQVLVADQETFPGNSIQTQTNLFGLDLIHQDDGTTTRTLLADGLGSVRMEMAAGAVETVTTYEPFGNLLARTGTSGTTYGFTGEQHTGFLYLRARYYNPYLKAFLSRDPHPGSLGKPSTQH
ncbi:MAG: hypothetical protein GY803_25325, partial [Chloroflexi bacterium]|nr:hypothetical protein [Chloroflexota bacterium]